MRSFNSSARYFLVQTLGISNAKAAELIVLKKMLINGEPAQIHQPIKRDDLVTLDDQVLKKPVEFYYLAYYKPRGIETTLNPEIPQNLLSDLKFSKYVYPVGRLDKESEGLLFLTNNGEIYNRILHFEEKQEKEYQVSVDKPLKHEDLVSLSNGIKIMGQPTLPAKVVQTSSNSFHITLIEGRNRQIRRMCYKLGLDVTKLKRTRIVSITLGQLKPGEYKELSQEEVKSLFRNLDF